MFNLCFVSALEAHRCTFSLPGAKTQDSHVIRTVFPKTVKLKNDTAQF